MLKALAGLLMAGLAAVGLVLAPPLLALLAYLSGLSVWLGRGFWRHLRGRPCQEPWVLLPMLLVLLPFVLAMSLAHALFAQVSGILLTGLVILLCLLLVIALEALHARLSLRFAVLALTSESSSPEGGKTEVPGGEEGLDPPWTELPNGLFYRSLWGVRSAWGGLSPGSMCSPMAWNWGAGS